jgi:2-amino-4-hydroxy-6-hydroxymethyldihydropteridine diphosphokinase
MSSAWRIDTAARDDAVRVHLGIGTNLGDLAGNVRRALDGLAHVVAIEAISSIYRTEPYGFADQPAFWNLAVRATTPLAPVALLRAVQRLEREIGRVATFRMGPRVIDIDILLYGDDVIAEPALAIPHPGLAERVFVLRPLLELDPELRDPRTGTPLVEYLAALGPDAGIERLGPAATVLAGRGDAAGGAGDADGADEG